MVFCLIIIDHTKIVSHHILNNSKTHEKNVLILIQVYSKL